MSRTDNLDYGLDLVQIFGTQRINGYANNHGKHIKGWKDRYPILWQSDEVMAWIKSKMFRFMSKGKEPSKFNVGNYVNALMKYIEFHKATIEELLQDDLDHRNMKLLQFLNAMIKQGENPVSVLYNYQSRIKSFFKSRGKPITEGLETKSSGVNRNELILSTELVKLIYNKLETTQYRLLNKFQALLGLRINDLLEELTSGKYKIEKYKDRYFIRNFLTQKEQVVINFLFIPKELELLIKSVMHVEDLTQLDLIPLFLTRQETRIRRADYLERIKIILKELSISQNGKTHIYRKFYETRLTTFITDNIIEDYVIQHYMGRKQLDLNRAYVQNLQNIEFMFQKFLQIEEKIQIDTVIVDRTSEKGNELEKIIEIQHNKINHLETQLEEIPELKDQLSKQEQEFESKVTKLLYRLLRKSSQLQLINKFQNEQTEENLESLVLNIRNQK